MKKKKLSAAKKKVVKKDKKPISPQKKKVGVKKSIRTRAVKRPSKFNKATFSFILTFFVIGVVAIAAISQPKKVLDDAPEVSGNKEEIVAQKVVEKKKEKEPTPTKKEVVVQKPEIPTPAPKPTKEESTERIAYLTFDADMTPRMKRDLDSGKVASWYSPEILSYLKAEKIPATIFATGMFAEAYPELIKDLAKNPLFSIQNHTYSHRAFTSNCYGLAYAQTVEEKVFELTRTQEVLKNLTGKTPTYVRLPGLCTNRETNKVIKDLGFKSSNSGIISDDAFQESVDVIVQNVLGGVHAGENIIIFHLGGPNAKHTQEAIKKIIPELKNRGYTFEKL